VGKTVLIADDDQAILDSLQMLLEDEGYSVKTTSDGWEAGELSESPPDVILLDIWMSGIDGRDLVRSLKASAATKEIPVVLISANREVARIAQQVGAEGYLAKPFEMEEMLEMIERVTAGVMR
jgi:CheY-like chemotaxis protein